MNAQLHIYMYIFAFIGFSKVFIRFIYLHYFVHSIYRLSNFKSGPKFLLLKLSKCSVKIIFHLHYYKSLWFYESPFKHFINGLT
jgi:hypothetical protein